MSRRAAGEPAARAAAGGRLELEHHLVRERLEPVAAERADELRPQALLRAAVERREPTPRGLLARRHARAGGREEFERALLQRVEQDRAAAAVRAERREQRLAEDAVDGALAHGTLGVGAAEVGAARARSRSCQRINSVTTPSLPNGATAASDLSANPKPEFARTESLTNSPPAPGCSGGGGD